MLLKLALSILFFHILLIICDADEDYYTLLGVPRNANDPLIKRAYKKLAVKWHPDKHRDPASKKKAQEQYQKVTTAYEVLKDKEKRRIYDQYGEEGLKSQGNGRGGGSPFDSFFNFGFGGRGSQGRQTEEQQGKPVTVELDVTLEDLYMGRIFTVSHKKQVLCPHCRGTGAEDPDDVKTCPVCNGRGIKITTQRLGPGFVTQTQSTCDKCGGKGKIIKTACSACSGAKVATGEETITVVVDRGMPSDGKIVFEQQGDETPGERPGDLIFQLFLLDHPKFRREGDDLHFDGTISLREALVGFKKHITHLDGHKVLLKRDGVTKPGFVMVLKGEGMPTLDSYTSQKERGDLFVTFTVSFPNSITEEQKEGFENLLP